MNTIVLEYRFTNHQKSMLLIFMGIPFTFFIFSSIERNTNFPFYISLTISLICYLLIIVTAFLKRGFLKRDGNLYITSFFLNKPITKTKIDISKKSKITVLKFNKSEKFAWFSIAKPDLSAKFRSFEINVLNDRHTRREIILDLKKKNNVQPTIDFLTSNFDLKYEKYAPNFR
jgi:hypothetical protein